MKTNTNIKRIKVALSPGQFLMIATLSLLWLFISAKPVFAAEIIVDVTGYDDTSCGTEVAPCRTIAYAVTNRTSSGDTVVVHAGTYTETITMRPGVVISGTGVAVTFIDGEGLRGPMVTAGTGVTASAILRGFTICRGVATAGAGIYILGTASPELRDLAVISNTATRGGGLYVEATASPHIVGLEFRHNHASGTAFGDGGGGLYVRGGLTLTDTQVISNTASAHGGGVYQYTDSGLLGWVGGRLERNLAGADGGATSDGGGMYVGGDLILTGTLVLSNTATKWGGGLYVDHNVTMTDVLVIDNIAGQWGGGLYQNVLFVYHALIAGGRFENNRLTWSNSVGGALFSSSPLTIIGTEVINNYAIEGGGLHGSSSMTLTAVQVLSNTAGFQGAGLDQNWLGGDDIDAWVYVTDTHFENNVALSSNGGAIRVEGNAALTRTQVISNSAAALGGGMYVQYDLMLHDTQVLSNTANSGGGIYQNGAGRQVTVTGGRIAYNVARNGGGGGVYTYSTLTLSGTHILTNTCSLWGGGVHLDGASANANWSAVNLIGNRAGQSGGGLYVGDASAQVTVAGGLWEGNIAEAVYSWNGGGGAYVYGLLSLNGTQIVHNRSGGIGGGALYVDGGLQTVNSLFSSNTASSGAAVYIRGQSGLGSYALIHTTITNDTLANGSAVYVDAGTVGITNTIIVSHTNGVFANSGSAVTIDGMLWYSNTADTGGAGSIIVNHGYTGNPAFAVDGYHLTAASMAIDKGVDPGVPVDIDGDVRPQGAGYDLGADEYVALPNLDIDKSVTPTTDVLYDGVVTYTIVLSNTGTGSDTNVILTDTLPSGVTFSQWLEYPASGLDHSGSAITWTGTVSASTLVTFTFMVTRTGGVGEIVNTTYFSGTLQKGQADATFATGSMVCEVQAALYTFNNQSGVMVEITTLGDELDCLYVDEIGVDHPFATGESGGSGIKTGRYWQIRGLQEDRVTDATGFTVVLTLPHTGLSEPKVCRYTGGAGYGWDCAVDGADDNTVWRTGITSFSEWAVGESVGPTAIVLRQLTALGGLWGAGVSLVLGAFLTLGIVVLRPRLTTRVGRYSRLRRTASSCR